MTKCQRFVFCTAGIAFVAWLATAFVMHIDFASVLGWVALIAFTIGFAALTIDYAKAVAAEDAEHG